MEVYLVKTLSGSLKPAYGSDHDSLSKIPLNEPVMFTYKKMRNPKFHRKFFALVNLVFQNQERYKNIEHLRKDLLIEAGYYDTRYNIHGVEIQEAKSISFASMDEVEFSEVYNRVIDVIATHFHFDRQEMLEEIEQYF